MKILTVGGGSGGHVTPVVVVCKELNRLDPNIELRFWCDKKFGRQARAAVHKSGLDLRVDTIAAGKLRRYHTLPLWRQLLRFRTIVWPNLRDMVFSFMGLIQSLFKLINWRPDVIFIKGGYVCLPVGVAAHWLRIPYIIHDSDVHPGLTNRILSRWAKAIATGAPLQHYSYPSDKTSYVGIPIDESFHIYSESEKQEAKRKLGFEYDKPLLVVTGGGLGAKTLNDAIVTELDELLKVTSVLLISGTDQYQELKEQTAHQPGHVFMLQAFISSGMADVLGAADVVVARAGATTLLELAAQATPTILVPNPYLTAGHQLKNAAVYAQKKAVVIVDEAEVVKSPGTLRRAVIDLIKNNNQRHDLSREIHGFARQNASRDVAQLIINAAKVPPDSKLVQ